MSLRRPGRARARAEKDEDENGDDGDGDVEAGRTDRPEHRQADTDTNTDPPDGGYGWVCVLAVFLLVAQTWGVSSSYAVFLNHYLTSRAFASATPLDFAFIGGLSIGIGLFLSPASTVAVARLGTRPSILIGIVFETAGFIGASFIRPGRHNIYQLFLGQSVCFGIGLSFIFVTTAAIVPQWFSRRRSVANAISTAGSGVGGVAYSLSVQAIIDRAGLSWAFRFLAISTFFFNLVAVVLIRDRNAETGARHHPFDLGLFRRRPQLVLLVAVGFFYMLGYIAVLFSIQSYATSIGLSPSQGSILSALLNVGQSLGRPAIGYFSDTVGRLNMALLTYALSSVFIFGLWIPATTYPILIAFALVAGLFVGTFWATAAPVSAEIIGIADLPAALTITWLFVAIPAVFSEPIVLGLRSAGPAYLGPQLFSAFMYLLSALCILALRALKLRDLDRERREESKSRPLPTDTIPAHDRTGEHVADADNDTVIPPHAHLPPRPDPLWRLAFFPTRV